MHYAALLEIVSIGNVYLYLGLIILVQTEMIPPLLFLVTGPFLLMLWSSKEKIKTPSKKGLSFYNRILLGVMTLYRIFLLGPYKELLIVTFWLVPLGIYSYKGVIIARLLFSSSIFMCFSSTRVVTFCLINLLEKTSLTDDDLRVLYLNPGGFQYFLESAKRGAPLFFAGLSAYSYNERAQIESATDRELISIDKKEDRAVDQMDQEINRAKTKGEVDMAAYRYTKKHEIFQKNREDVVSLGVKKKEETLVGKAIKFAETGKDLFGIFGPKKK